MLIHNQHRTTRAQSPVHLNNTIVNPYYVEELRQSYQEAKPFPWIKIDNFLQDEFLQELIDSYPNFETAKDLGLSFKAINESQKIQITDKEKFPEPVAELNQFLNSEHFLHDLETITGISNLLADSTLKGGGMHVSGPSGRLDVHIDFNYEKKFDVHRRLNILLYLNPGWKKEWGGAIELWDKEVKNCVHSFEPISNRMVLFETSHISYHGVEPISCPKNVCHQSFAGYYYTKEAPEHWDGQSHSTVFVARPHEYMRRNILMPVEKAFKTIQKTPDYARLLKNKILNKD